MFKSLSELMGYSSVDSFADDVTIIGFCITVIAFSLTLLGVYRSASSAKAAQSAAKSAVDKIQILNSMVQLNTISQKLAEIKKWQMAALFDVLPEKYSEVRRLLSLIKNANNLEHDDFVSIQSIIAQLANIQNSIEANIVEPNSLTPKQIIRINNKITQQEDKLNELHVKLQKGIT